ncbi:MAG: hypothetical protein ACREM2_07625, partial [Vulcanimicrobiaceae bacterium]
MKLRALAVAVCVAGAAVVALVRPPHPPTSPLVSAGADSDGLEDDEPGARAARRLRRGAGPERGGIV